MKRYTFHVCVALLFAGVLLDNFAAAEDQPSASQTKPTTQPADDTTGSERAFMGMAAIMAVAPDYSFYESCHWF